MARKPAYGRLGLNHFLKQNLQHLEIGKAQSPAGGIQELFSVYHGILAADRLSESVEFSRNAPTFPVKKPCRKGRIVPPVNTSLFNAIHAQQFSPNISARKEFSQLHAVAIGR